MRINYTLIILSLFCSGLLGQQSGLEVSGEIKSDSIDVNSGIIKNVKNPIDAQDVVTKSYFEQILFDFALATMVDTSKTVQGLLDAGILPNTILNEGIDSIYFIGLNYAGGIIFYMESNGTGLVAAPGDQSTEAEWGCAVTEITGAEGVLIGSGNQNTIDI